MPVMLALRRLRQEDYEFEASLGYIAIPSLKGEKKCNPYLSMGQTHIWAHLG
jgi:hypothetical protein